MVHQGRVQPIAEPFWEDDVAVMHTRVGNVAALTEPTDQACFGERGMDDDDVMQGDEACDGRHEPWCNDRTAYRQKSRATDHTDPVEVFVERRRTIVLATDDRHLVAQHCPPFGSALRVFGQPRPVRRIKTQHDEYPHTCILHTTAVGMVPTAVQTGVGA